MCTDYFNVRHLWLFNIILKKTFLNGNCEIWFEITWFCIEAGGVKLPSFGQDYMLILLKDYEVRSLRPTSVSMMSPMRKDTTATARMKSSLRFLRRKVEGYMSTMAVTRLSTHTNWSRKKQEVWDTYICVYMYVCLCVRVSVCVLLT